MPDQRTIIRYNLPRSQVDAIGDLARRHRTRHSAIAEALLAAALARIEAGADVVTLTIRPAPQEPAPVDALPEAPPP